MDALRLLWPSAGNASMDMLASHVLLITPEISPELDMPAFRVLGVWLAPVIWSDTRK